MVARRNLSKTAPSPPKMPAHLRTICMYCDQQRLTFNRWGAAAEKLVNEPISHGICPTCYREAVRELSRQFSTEVGHSG